MHATYAGPRRSKYVDFCNEFYFGDGILTVKSVMDCDRYVHPVHGGRIVECLVNIPPRSERAMARLKATVSLFLISFLIIDKRWHNPVLGLVEHHIFG